MADFFPKREAAVEGENTKRLQQALKGVKEEELPRDGRYETAKRIGGKRNRAWKTDPEAPFMRMQEEAMGTGQVQPGYRVPSGREQGLVCGYARVPQPADTRTVKAPVRRQEQGLGEKRQALSADAGEGSAAHDPYGENPGMEAAVQEGMDRKAPSRKRKAERQQREQGDEQRTAA